MEKVLNQTGKLLLYINMSEYGILTLTFGRKKKKKKVFKDP